MARLRGLILAHPDLGKGPEKTIADELKTTEQYVREILKKSGIDGVGARQ